MNLGWCVMLADPARPCDMIHERGLTLDAARERARVLNDAANYLHGRPRSSPYVVYYAWYIPKPPKHTYPRRVADARA